MSHPQDVLVRAERELRIRKVEGDVRQAGQLGAVEDGLRGADGGDGVTEQLQLLLHLLNRLVVVDRILRKTRPTRQAISKHPEADTQSWVAAATRHQPG